MENLDSSTPANISGTIISPSIENPDDFGSQIVLGPTSSNLNAINMTYNVQNDLRKYRLKRYLKQSATVLSKTKGGIIDEGDALLNYDIDGDNRINRADRQEEPDPERYYKEVRRVLNLNSRFRLAHQWVVADNKWLFDNFKQLCQPFWCEDSQSFTEPNKLVNQINKQIADPTHRLIVKKAQICRLVPLANSASEYIFPLENTLNNIKTLTLLSSEIPNSLPTLTYENNIMIIDLVKSGTELPVKYKEEYLLPYILIKIPCGNYELTELAETIEEQINSSIYNFTLEKYKNLFQVLADPETDAVMFKINPVAKLEFHLVMKPHPRFQELSLHYMLGFKDYQTPNYVTTWSNLTDQKVNYGIGCLKVTEKKPFRPIDLNPYKYIYLAIEGFKTIEDPLIKGYDLFAKFQLEPSETRPKMLFNTYINNPKIFVDSPLRILETLKIAWVDAFGQLVDFQNREHSLTLEFLVYVDYLVDSNFSSLRGTRDTSSFTQSSLRQK